MDSKEETGDKSWKPEKSGFRIVMAWESELFPKKSGFRCLIKDNTAVLGKETGTFLTVFVF